MKYWVLLSLLFLAGCSDSGGGTTTNAPEEEVYYANWELDAYTPLAACEGIIPVNYHIAQCLKNRQSVDLSLCSGLIKLPEQIKSPAGLVTDDGIKNYKNQIIGYKIFNCSEGQLKPSIHTDINCTDSRYVKQKNNGVWQCNAYFKQLDPYPITSEDKYYSLKSFNNPCNGCSTETKLGTPLYSADIKQVWERQSVYIDQSNMPIYYNLPSGDYGGGLVFLLQNGKFVFQWNIITPNQALNSSRQEWTFENNYIGYNGKHTEFSIRSKTVLDQDFPEGWEMSTMPATGATGKIYLKIKSKTNSQIPKYLEYNLLSPFSYYKRLYGGGEYSTLYSIYSNNIQAYPIDSFIMYIESSSEWIGIKSEDSTIDSPTFFPYLFGDGTDITNRNRVVPVSSSVWMDYPFTMDREGKQMCFQNEIYGTYCYTYRLYYNLLSIERMWAEPVKIYNTGIFTCLITKIGDLYCRKEPQKNIPPFFTSITASFAEQLIDMNSWTKIVTESPIKDIRISNDYDIYLLGTNNKIYTGASSVTYRHSDGRIKRVTQMIPLHEDFLNSYQNDAENVFNFSIFDE